MMTVDRSPKSMTHVDVRCPKCDGLLRGRQEVASVSSLAGHKGITRCKHCNTKVALCFTPAECGEMNYFYFKTT